MKVLTFRVHDVSIVHDVCFRFRNCSPTNPRLLGVNVNRGVQVKLRLRRVNHDLDFLSYHEILDTMLHELCHNAHGPHNASFYKLWDELRKVSRFLFDHSIIEADV